MCEARDILVKFLLAVLLSGLIGFEREAHGRAAGLRTHILVCMGSTLIMLTSIHVFNCFSSVATVDPGRIAAGVVTGIGFLGAGTIIRSGTSVKGLTTAASLWVVAGIGLAIGSGLYYAAFVASVLVLIVLVVLNWIEHTVIKKVKEGES